MFLQRVAKTLRDELRGFTVAIETGKSPDGFHRISLEGPKRRRYTVGMRKQNARIVYMGLYPHVGTNLTTPIKMSRVGTAAGAARAARGMAKVIKTMMAEYVESRGDRGQLVERIEALESTARHGGHNMQLLRAYIDDPTYYGSEELSDAGWEILKTEAAGQKAFNRRSDIVAMLRRERERIKRHSIPWTMDGWRQYRRVNRKGSKFPLTAKMRLGAFMVLAAENLTVRSSR